MKRKLLSLFVVAGLLLCGFVGSAFAKDEALLQAMVNLEKTYIPPLFQTNMELPATPKGMMIFNAEWNKFKAAYEDYRPNYANWGAYFDEMQSAIDSANAIVQSGSSYKPAHEQLEVVRLTMLTLRTHNGYPKFITDKMTLFHGPMEEAVLTVLNNKDNLTEELLVEVDAMLVDAIKAWCNVEKCPIDAGMWGFSPEQMAQYYMLVQQERTALTNYVQILASRNIPEIIAKAPSIKAPFISAYTFFGDFTPFQPAP